MKTLLAAALVLSAQSQDETYLMQGLARRVDGKLGGDDSPKHDTARLMETATRMLKTGAGATPDVVAFITETVTELQTNVLGAITFGHDEDQAELARIVGEMEAAITAYNLHLTTHAGAVAEYDTDIANHKTCRSEESQDCGDSRECEVELERRWQHVREQEAAMRQIHDQIHNSWCVHPLVPPHGERTCFGQDACWDWPNPLAMEGPETSQTTGEYPIADYSGEVRDFRDESVETFGQYKIQKDLTEEAWTAYNVQIVQCSGFYEVLETKRGNCDGVQDAMDSGRCTLSQNENTARRVFGEEWRRVTNDYDTAEGTCTNSEGEACDIHAFHAHEIAGGNTWEGAAVDLTCSCTGTRQKEFDRMREWETLNIVTCLLNTVYTHVTHSIETNEPCPTIESHPEQTQNEIDHCHHIELSDTANLTIDYCGDDLPLVECPEPPEAPHPEEPKCSAQYNWDTVGHNTLIEANEPVHVRLSDAGWSTCAAPKACVACEGTGSDLPDPDYVAPSAPCMWHQSHLLLLENNQDTFRCGGSWCLPMAGRCNGVSNCGDGSDEIGCDTEPPLWLGKEHVCRSDVTHTPGQQDDVNFFCNDGSCTPVQGRCNGHPNCADGSDEVNCPTNADAVTVETSSGLPATLETVTNGARVFHDRLYTFKSIGSFTGIKYVKTSNEDKYISHDHVAMKLRLQHPSTVYIVTTEGQTLPWLYSEGWTEVPALTGLQYSGLRMTPHKQWSAYTLLPDTTYTGLPQPLAGRSEQFDAIDEEEQHYGGGQVWEKTFPAGAVHLRGNGGGQGYDWTPGVEGGRGSYLTFVAHPSHPATPVAPPAPVSDWTVGVELTGNGETVAIDIGDTEFDRLFNLCPVVKYTRNGGVHSVYVREAGRPQVDAFSLFTYRWANQDNVLNTDFKIYDSEADARSGTGAWTSCNYNDADVGYPRDCGRNGRQNNHWFSMPADGQHDANSGGGAQRFNIRNILAGASFEVYTGSDCPVAEHACAPAQDSTVDAGYTDAYRGWYDVQGCGECNDYCRWVGNTGSLGDPSVGFSLGQNANGNPSWWSCRLAGSDSAYSPRGLFSSFNFQKCN